MDAMIMETARQTMSWEVSVEICKRVEVGVAYGIQGHIPAWFDSADPRA